MKNSTLQELRYLYKPILPKALQAGVVLRELENTTAADDQEEIKQLFPQTYGMPLIAFEQGEQSAHEPQNVGVILSGGQAAGGHNVIAGLYDGLMHMNPESKLYGFLGGPGGLVDHRYKLLTGELIDTYRNTGGFDIIGSGRTKLEEISQFESGYEICRQLGINAIVIIGGDDSNTNACVLAEYYKQKGYNIQVIGCPKTIDGDLKGEMIETSFGFDTACKVYSELIGNVQRDAASAKKYWHFMRLMGRSASHITLECALQTHPNIALIAEEVTARGLTLKDIVAEMVRMITARANEGLNYGSVLVPEGLIEFLPSMHRLISELNEILAETPNIAAMTDDDRNDFLRDRLTPEAATLYFQMPPRIARQFTLDRDPHGNVQVSMIETEKILIELIKKQIDELKKEGKFKGKFAAMTHFFGYEGRCSFPSNFDTNYCYSLGYTAAALVAERRTGYMAAVRNLAGKCEDWQPCGVPITMMMNMEQRNGARKPVIRKSLVDVNGAPFKYFEAHREIWADHTDTYVYPGPIQYFGPDEMCNRPTITLLLEHGKYTEE